MTRILRELRWRYGSLRQWWHWTALRKMAWRLPRGLVIWAFARVAAHATQGRWGGESPDAVSVMTAMKRWDLEQ